MDIALCLTDGHSYDIASFSKLEARSLDKLRRTLVCNECNGKAYYSKQSRDGKSAHFGAYHEDNCADKQDTAVSKFDPRTIEEVNRINTNSATIDVDFKPYTARDLEQATNARPPLSGDPPASSRQYTRQPAQDRNATKGLRSLLRMLMYTDTFATSDIAINTGWGHPYKAKNLFVNFDHINENLIGKMRGYWGIISHADPGINWLNTANEQDVSIPVPELNSYLVDTYNIITSEDLSGAAALVFGWLNISKDNKKWYIRIHKNDPGRIFIKLKK